MEIESSCFYLVRLADAERIVFALNDAKNHKLRFIRDMSAGPEESLDCSNIPVIKRYGFAHEICADDFARRVMTHLVKVGIELDTLEFLHLLENIQSSKVALTDLEKMTQLVQEIQVERVRTNAARQRLWHNFSSRAAL